MQLILQQQIALVDLAPVSAAGEGDYGSITFETLAQLASPKEAFSGLCEGKRGGMAGEHAKWVAQNQIVKLLYQAH